MNSLDRYYYYAIIIDEPIVYVGRSARRKTRQRVNPGWHRTPDGPRTRPGPITLVIRAHTGGFV